MVASENVGEAERPLFGTGLLLWPPSGRLVFYPFKDMRLLGMGPLTPTRPMRAPIREADLEQVKAIPNLSGVLPSGAA